MTIKASALWEQMPFATEIDVCSPHATPSLLLVPGLLRRRVAEPGIPDRRPANAQQTEHEEGSPPSIPALDGNYQELRDSPSDLARRERDARHRGSLRGREPASH